MAATTYKSFTHIPISMLIFFLMLTFCIFPAKAEIQNVKPPVVKTRNSECSANKILLFIEKKNSLFVEKFEVCDRTEAEDIVYRFESDPVVKTSKGSKVYVTPIPLFNR